MKESISMTKANNKKPHNILNKALNTRVDNFFPGVIEFELYSKHSQSISSLKINLLFISISNDYVLIYFFPYLFQRKPRSCFSNSSALYVWIF